MQKIRLHKKVQSYVLENKLEYSSQEVKNNITSFGVKIDSNLVFNHHQWLYTDENIDLNHWPKRLKSDFTKVKILFENDEFLVVNKDINQVVEAGTGHKYDNLIYQLSIQKNMELFNAHRIDKDTKGLLLIAKNIDALNYLQNLFKKRQIRKKYIALVHGSVEKTYHITNYQTRDKSNTLRQKFFWHETEALNYDKDARESVSIIKPFILCPELNKSIVEVEIKTGRMHQIRLQLETLGFKLVADNIYNGDKIAYSPLELTKFKTILRKTLHNNEYKKVNIEKTKEVDESENNKYKEFYSLEPIKYVKTDEFEVFLNKFGVTDLESYFLQSSVLEFLYKDGKVYMFDLLT
jgi:23S rRNA pseudouridine1911/1915/1917 synthase